MSLEFEPSPIIIVSRLFSDFFLVEISENLVLLTLTIFVVILTIKLKKDTGWDSQNEKISAKVSASVNLSVTSCMFRNLLSWPFLD